MGTILETTEMFQIWKQLKMRFWFNHCRHVRRAVAHLTVTSHGSLRGAASACPRFQRVTGWLALWFRLCHLSFRLYIRGPCHVPHGLDWSAKAAHRTLEISSLTRWPVYYKGMNSGAARGKRCMGQRVWGRGMGPTPCPDASPFPHLHSSPTGSPSEHLQLGFL